LMRIFAGEWVKNILTRLGMKEGEAIESRMVTRRIEGAQKKVEERNFEIRKNLLEYDEVMDEQRKRVYGYRQRILDGDNCRDLMLEMIDGQIDHALETVLDPDYGAESFAAAAGAALGVQLEPRDYRNSSYDDASRQATTEALRQAESQVYDAIDENLSSDADEDEWNWNAMAHWSNARWGTNYRDRDLKKIGRDQIDAQLLKDARQAIETIDLESCARYLEPDYSVKTACSWLHDKFGIELAPDEMANVEAAEFLSLAHEKARAAYDERESEFPVLAGLIRFSQRDSSGQRTGLSREGLVAWAKQRFGVDLSLDDLKNKQREEVRQLLVQYSRQSNEKANQLAEEGRQRVDALFAEGGSQTTLGQATGHNGKLDDLASWLAEACQCEVSQQELAKLDQDEARRKVMQAIEDRYRPEMRRLERSILLQILDQGWKEHLLTMDHLRSSVGLRGYAQVDPKVEYKREGMRLFDDMWRSVGNYVTDLIFKMENLDEGFVGSTWKESAAIHEEAPGTSDMAQQQRAAIEGSQGQVKAEPIRNREEKVGRNSLCPCGSGKKYKNCCGGRG
ncbi:MAG: SEC-C domain-containing protein, partial [Planctomycetales bacterium]|nr:SEC-C domain-containing protein [Planctomycetales bacterium]